MALDDDSPIALQSRCLEAEMDSKQVKAAAAKIAANVRDVDAGRITWEEFGRRQRAVWDSVTRGELAIIGSACSRRLAAVHKAMKAAA